MALRIIENDITKMQVDAIVNSTNEHLVGYSGVDRIIHELGGQALEDECDRLRDTCVLGEAVYTNAYNLPCRYLIHTICPIWNYGVDGDEAILRSCYRQSLEIAGNLGCESVAFPLISAGSMGFPIARALANAVTTISEYLALYGEDMDVYLVLYGEVVTQIAETMFGDLDNYIAENYCGEEDSPEKSICLFEAECVDASVPDYEECDQIFACNEAVLEKQKSCKIMSSVENSGLKPYDSLDDLINQKHETFVDKLYRFMDEKGIEKASQLYKRAGVSKATYSKLISGESRKPSLETAVGLAMALHLTYDEAVELFASAGIALSNSSRFDIIVSYFLKNRNYNTWDMDVQLLKYGYKTIFSTL